MARTVALCAALAISALCAPPSSAEEAPHAHVLLLPVDFNVVHGGLSMEEILPDETKAARLNLGDAAREVLLAHGAFELDPLPQLSPEEEQVLHRHVALARLIATQADDYRHSPWRDHRAQLDRGLGDGLAFLHERTGAGYALLVTGSQLTRCMLCPPLTANGQKKRTEVSLLLIDLKDGNVSWFNSTVTYGLFGVMRRDVSERDDARKVLAKLLEPYPRSPALTD
jgi:hypothetical protein